MINWGVLGRERVEGWVIMGGLVGIQFIYAGNAVFFSYLMSLGVSPLSHIILSTLPTFFPVSFTLAAVPKEIQCKAFISACLCSIHWGNIVAIIIPQGVEDDFSSNCYSHAQPRSWHYLSNLLGFRVFICPIPLTNSIYFQGLFNRSCFTSYDKIICHRLCRFEPVRLSCNYSRVKIIGTLICVIGRIFDKEKIVGCLYLALAVFILSSNVVLQAHILGELPAPMTLCAVTSLIGFVTTMLAQLAQEHRIRLSLPLVRFCDLITFSLFVSKFCGASTLDHVLFKTNLLGFLGGVCVSFSGWALKKRGPVLVSMLSPIATVISTILSSFNRHLRRNYYLWKPRWYVPDVRWSLFHALGKRQRKFANLD
ncbi:hypothetical protein Cgig2_005259 [Carnegiea gigantea]|uniref:Uncharacterized protein n=1 Tax=Carnegiea gigantea TaxID=171969 RepID=A0A9Q1QD36_9CARY|nr:hypothetical protein Cgig2_005259 [Carnegiea gigantea]